jgi:beta-catenin-like protein 1
MGGNKRKMPDNPTPEMLKKMKMGIEQSKAAVGDSPSKSPVGTSRRATVEDAEDDDMQQDFAPGGDADYFVEEDDEGRFFGGGLTSEQKDILRCMCQSFVSLCCIQTLISQKIFLLLLYGDSY